MGACAIFALLALVLVFLTGEQAGQRWARQACFVTNAGRQNAGRQSADRQNAGRQNAGEQPQNSEPNGICDVPLLLELIGSACESGLAIPRALRLVAEISTPQVGVSLSQVVAGLEIGASWEHAWEGASHQSAVGSIRDALSFAALTGAPAAPLLYAEAAACRRESQRNAEKRAAALGVKLVIPLGLCSLPAFVVLGIIPVVVAMIPAL
ncbi:type II secretion system F family protein [Arthrobacter cryoconiti]|uniref:Type II secretion system F family protein n=1 Tax=Arthrobacter cryoconiti TaxID=748907 RepID=A0ABV8R1Y9_9MICC|nr:type II secretion system F family protein [Arthrobacter cryoconiti]MCC9068036.1 type II secretion system F family protein [Arthrobacter cryoconiti]